MLILVMYLATDGNNKYQVKYMHKKAIPWETSVRLGGIQQNKAWKALNSTILHTMKYSLSAITLNEKECKHIMQHIINFWLTKDGISSSLHTVFRYGPRSLEGIVLFDPFVIQVTGWVALLIKNYWKSTPSSPFFWYNLSTLQLE